MGYKDEFQKSQEKGKTKVLTTIIYTWESEGQELYGVVHDVRPFKLGKFDTEVDCYIIQTDDGLITTVLGSATDKQLKEVDPIGMKIYILYKGKKQLDDGRQVNLFHVEVA